LRGCPRWSLENVTSSTHDLTSRSGPSGLPALEQPPRRGGAQMVHSPGRSGPSGRSMAKLERDGCHRNALLLEVAAAFGAARVGATARSREWVETSPVAAALRGCPRWSETEDGGHPENPWVAAALRGLPALEPL